MKNNKVVVENGLAKVYPYAIVAGLYKEKEFIPLDYTQSTDTSTFPPKYSAEIYIDKFQTFSDIKKYGVFRGLYDLNPVYPPEFIASKIATKFIFADKSEKLEDLCPIFGSSFQ